MVQSCTDKVSEHQNKNPKNPKHMILTVLLRPREQVFQFVEHAVHLFLYIRARLSKCHGVWSERERERERETTK